MYLICVNELNRLLDATARCYTTLSYSWSVAARQVCGQSYAYSAPVNYKVKRLNARCLHIEWLRMPGSSTHSCGCKSLCQLLHKIHLSVSELPQHFLSVTAGLGLVQVREKLPSQIWASYLISCRLHA